MRPTVEHPSDRSLQVASPVHIDLPTPTGVVSEGVCVAVLPALPNRTRAEG